jgi:hypothetical protein
MVAGERAYAVGTQELVFVEHRRQYAAQLALIEDGRQLATGMARRVRVVNECGEFRARLHEFAQSPFRLGNRVHKVPGKGGDRAQRKESHHGANLEAL